MRQIIDLNPTRKSKRESFLAKSKAGRESALSARVSFDPSLRYYWRIAAIGGWGGGPGHKKAIAMTGLNSDEVMMVVEASYPLQGAETPRRPACGP
jgi:hypothetical protein